MAKHAKRKVTAPGPATTLVHGGIERSHFGETSEAIFLTQGYVYETAESAEARFKGDDPGHVYSRYSNPTVAMFEERMRLLEGAGGARATASGMAAVNTALMASLSAGDHVVAAKALFGSCRYIIEDLLPRFGVRSTLVDGADLAQWKRAVRKGKTKALFLESPTNPTLELVDIAAVADIAHKAGAKLIVDNVFATPLLQKPLALGADVVVYSATKHIDGQGRCLGGVVLGDEDFIDKVHTLLKHTGPSMSPFNAWVLLKGLETLPIRVERQCSTAAILADRIADHPAVKRTLYPGRPDHPQADLAARQMSGGSTLIAFEMKGGKKKAFAVSNALKVICLSNNLGDAKSLITHPSTTTHQRLTEEARRELGITQGVLRFSVGLEDVEDLWADLSRALDKAA
ncbi:MAG: O-succinylhomoserine sulfhydrylase [Bauldia sp.]|uniref:O-succinylhomoserine sulfhydrylase n=1 Tax=Bauldia sp. TaxID=2575872 RepID=UPI001D6E3B21|nr:O-succinylhomoserine sulfhydrylase [Bauldia sp.]MCB1496701.1 O-succinylhomoserine sulfhydrylase [Bauldia sp.]